MDPRVTRRPTSTSASLPALAPQPAVAPAPAAAVHATTPAPEVPPEPLFEAAGIHPRPTPPAGTHLASHRDPFTQDGGAPIFPLAVAGKEARDLFGEVCGLDGRFCASHGPDEALLARALAAVPGAIAATRAFVARPAFQQADAAGRNAQLLAFVRNGDWAPASVPSVPLPPPRTEVKLDAAHRILRVSDLATDRSSGIVLAGSSPAHKGWAPSDTDLAQALSALDFHALLHLTQIKTLSVPLFEASAPDVQAYDPVLSGSELWMIPLETGIELQPLSTPRSSAELAGALVECAGMQAAYFHFDTQDWDTYAQAAQDDRIFVSHEAQQSLVHDFRQTWKHYHQLDNASRTRGSLVFENRFRFLKDFVAQLQELKPPLRKE